MPWSHRPALDSRLRYQVSTISISRGPHVRFDRSRGDFAHNVLFAPYRPVGMPGLWGKEVDYNFLHNPAISASAPATLLQKDSHQDSHSLTGNAMFVDPAHGDYSVRESSPARSLGFKNFPMTGFGVTSPSLRAIARTPSFAIQLEAPSKRDPGVRDWLGAKVRNILGQGEQSAYGITGETGVLVLDVPADSPLAKAALRINDVVVSAAGSTIDTVTDLLRATRLVAPGSELTIGVSRDQKITQLTVIP